MKTKREGGLGRRAFLRGAGTGAAAICAGAAGEEPKAKEKPSEESYEEPAKRLPARKFDVVIAGGGTAGVRAAIAAARQGAKTALISSRRATLGTCSTRYCGKHFCMAACT